MVYGSEKWMTIVLWKRSQPISGKVRNWTANIFLPSHLACALLANHVNIWLQYSMHTWYSEVLYVIGIVHTENSSYMLQVVCIWPNSCIQYFAEQWSHQTQLRKLLKHFRKEKSWQQLWKIKLKKHYLQDITAKTKKSNEEHSKCLTPTWMNS